MNHDRHFATEWYTITLLGDINQIYFSKPIKWGKNIMIHKTDFFKSDNTLNYKPESLHGNSLVRIQNNEWKGSC